jgi:hypothetical protein
VVKEYPLSSLAGDAKDKLVKFGSPVPDPDPVALARMKREQQLPRDRGSIFLAMPGALLHSGPDVSMAARVGMPTLTPETEDMNDTLSPGAGLSVVASGAGASASSGGGGGYVPMASSGDSDTASQSSANPATAPTAPGAPDPSVAATQNPANQNGQPPAANASPDSSPASADPSASPSTSSTSSPSPQAGSQGESTSSKKKKKNKK